MSKRELHRGQDKLGSILITEDANKRYLSFGAGDEQSCILKATPWVPQYPFVRAMLLPLLFLEPRRVLSLGLGAGSLNQALHQAYPSLKQQIVELREQVVELAYRYFYLQRSKRINIEVSDARDYLDEPSDTRYDLLFSDLYTEAGVDEFQKQTEFLDACAKRLKPQGWLVINAWVDDRSDDILDHLSDRFDYMFSCVTVDGNWILYATNQFTPLTQSQAKEGIRTLSNRLGYAVGPHFKRMKQLK